MTAASRGVQVLAAAIRDALDVPTADSHEPGAGSAEDMLRLKRVHFVRGVLAGLAEDPGTVMATADVIREAAAQFPVTYPVRRRAEAES